MGQEKEDEPVLKVALMAAGILRKWEPILQSASFQRRLLRDLKEIPARYLRRRRKPHYATIMKVARVNLMMERGRIPQYQACDFEEVDHKTHNEHRDHPQVLEEMERLRQDKEFQHYLKDLLTGA